MAITKIKIALLLRRWRKDLAHYEILANRARVSEASKDYSEGAWDAVKKCIQDLEGAVKR